MMFGVLLFTPNAPPSELPLNLGHAAPNQDFL
jgi:hypothetical protein